MTHPNDMTAWSEIACQRDHTTHETRRVTVDLELGHGYHDYPQVPARLERSFTMDVYDPAVYPVDGGPYCPAHDAVSETIVSHRIWEPRETILTLQVCTTAQAGQGMVDIGCQLGWYSLLAMSCGLDVVAIDADAENLRALKGSARANGWGDHLAAARKRLGPRARPMPIPPTGIRFVKIDVEGAEDQAVRVLWPSIAAGQVDHMLVEISPVFADYYPDLVGRLVAAGYRAYLLPDKAQPPVSLDDPARDLVPYRIDQRADLAELIASWHQENVWLVREGATW